MSKIYAVRSGRNTGVFTNWADCEAQVKGFAGAEYKSFKSVEDAKAYLNPSDVVEAVPNEEVAEEPSVTVESTVGMHAYVDGSFNKDLNIAGWGYLLVHNGVIVEQASGHVMDEDLIVSANVAGELAAAMRVALWSHQNQMPVAIHYDYNGIEKWMTGEWQARSVVAKHYLAFMETVSSLVSFVKVKAHSGNKLNDAADRLAYNATTQD